MKDDDDAIVVAGFQEPNLPFDRSQPRETRLYFNLITTSEMSSLGSANATTSF
jgi:hypothetical protein